MTSKGMRRVVPIGVYAMALVASGCDDSPTANPLVPVAARLDILGGDQQTGLVGFELPAPLIVQVVDPTGNSVPNQIVNFRVTGGGGSVYAGTGFTNDDGVAMDWWTLGDEPGLQTVEARAVDPATGDALVFATFEATAVHPDSLVALVSVTPSAADLSVGDTEQLTATAWNASGEPLPGKTFIWASSDPNVVTVAADGLVTAVSTGSATVIARVGGRIGASFITVSGG